MISRKAISMAELTKWPSKLLAAAIEFCGYERELAEIRRMTSQCEYASPPEYDVGYDGDPPCFYNNCLIPPEDYCDPCKANYEKWEKRYILRRTRRNARRRMFYAFDKLTEGKAE